jgi:hypothetical protein
MADVAFYSEKTIQEFIKSKLCQDDDILYKYYENDKVKKFRNRLSKIKNIDNDVKNVVQTCITDATRDIIRTTIGSLGLYMRPFGDLIVSGGEAFNAYFDRDTRIVTSDIDTKFVPVIRLNKNKVITSKNLAFFGYLQITKLILWEQLGKLVMRLNTIICKRVEQFVIKSKIGKLLGISFSGIQHPLKRRYTLLKKSKETGVLIDIELFAIDLQIKYFLPSENKVGLHNIGGILDIAFMRPAEFGYEVTYTKNSGMYIRNPVSKKLTYDKSILIASKKFLIDDLYYLQKYKLRPLKKEKDRKRMFTFCKYVLKVDDISPTESLESIYKKSIHKAKSSPTNLLKRPIFSKRYLTQALKVNPLKFENITTEPVKTKVIQQLFYGIKGENNLKIPGYYPTYSNYRFLANNGIWVKNENPAYIHNEANYRPNKINRVTKVQLKDILYGYNPVRDNWVPDKILQNSAMIPLVGLKNKSFINVNV